MSASAQEIAEMSALSVQETAEKLLIELGFDTACDCSSCSKPLETVLSAITAAVAQQKTDAEAWRLVAKSKEGAYVTMEADLAHVKGELAYMKLQRDALLDITWLDLPGEPSESIAKWREQFSSGWQRKVEVAAAVEQKDAKIQELENTAYNVPLCGDHAAAWFTDRRFKEGECWICLAAVAQAKEEENTLKRLLVSATYPKCLCGANTACDEPHAGNCEVWLAITSGKALELKEPSPESNPSTRKAHYCYPMLPAGAVDEPDFELHHGEQRACSCGKVWQYEAGREAGWREPKVLSEHSNAAGAPTGKQEVEHEPDCECFYCFERKGRG